VLALPKKLPATVTTYISPTATATLVPPDVRLPPPDIAPVLALKPSLNSNKPTIALCTKAVVAILVELSPEFGVIT